MVPTDVTISAYYNYIQILKIVRYNYVIQVLRFVSLI